MEEIVPTPKVIHYDEVPGVEFGEEAPGVTIRVLIDEEHDGAPNYALRMIEIATGGNTPDHDHPYEHENFVVEGRGQVLIAEGWHDVAPGDVIFVPPGVRHTYKNTGEETLRFLCGIPVPRLRP